MFPKLRLKVKPNLVQLQGGLASLPITQSEQRATPLTPVEWKTHLKEALAAPTSTKVDPMDDVTGVHECDV